MENIAQVDFTGEAQPCERPSCPNPQYPIQTGSRRFAVRNAKGKMRMYCDPCYRNATGMLIYLIFNKSFPPTMVIQLLIQ
jgi:hypothetical protein